MLKIIPLCCCLPLLASCAILGEVGAAGVAVEAGSASVLVEAGAASEITAISRVMVTEDAAAAGMDGLSGSVSDGVLQRALQRLTADGTRSGTLTISRSGIVQSGTSDIAAISPETGEFRIGDRTVGRINDSIISEIGRNSGESRQIAELRGFVPAARLRIGLPSEGVGFDVLSESLSVRVDAIRQGQYLIRVGSQEAEWIDASLVTLAILPLGSASQHCPYDHGALMMRSGRTLKFENCSTDDGLTVLTVNGQETLIYDSEVDGFIDQNTVEGLAANRIALRGGDAVFGHLQKFSNFFVISGDGQTLMLGDISRLAG